jgi:hypothetical protein
MNFFCSGLGVDIGFFSLLRPVTGAKDSLILTGRICCPLYRLGHAYLLYIVVGGALCFSKTIDTMHTKAGGRGKVSSKILSFAPLDSGTTVCILVGT